MNSHHLFFTNKGRCFTLAVISFVLLLLTPLTALCHNVTIFAWVEGDTVYTESKFSGGRKAKEALIEVYDTAGVKLLTGRTDQNGEFSFKLQKKEVLKIVLAAGMGHGNEWVLTAEDIATAQSDSPATPEPAASSVSETPPKETAASTASAADSPDVTVPEFQAALEKALDQKLAPVLKKLSHLEATRKEGVGITEIIGGIGYILGLMGLAAFIHYKRKSAGFTP